MVFLISHMVPSNPVAANLNQTALNDPEIVAAYEAKWGLDKPLHEQYIVYMSNLLRGDFGTSIRTGRPVLQDLKQYFPATVELSIFAMIIAIVLGWALECFPPSFKTSRRIRFCGPFGQRCFPAQLLVCPAGDVGVLRQASVVSQRGKNQSRIFNPTGGTGLYVLDAISWVTGKCWWMPFPPCPSRHCAGLFHHGPHYPPNPLQPSGGHVHGLHPHRPLQGHEGAQGGDRPLLSTTR